MKNILVIILLFFTVSVSAQEIIGKWTGSFNDQRDNKTSYVIEITNETGVLNATTTTIFKISSTSYFIVCSTKVELDSAKQKITITELEIIKANTPEWFSNCLQKHVLTFSTDTKNAYLKGKWEAIKQKTIFCGGEGDTFLKKGSK